ncbi:MAG: hypothetical protein JNK38_09600 [Acidobacteria bacterium]|nr:hypothetical protein [Acidobacteriota bacterium]
MLKPLFELFKQVFTINEDLQRQRAEIKELRHQYHSLILLVQKLESKIERVQSDDKHEREKIVLQLQNTLLQFERRLLPATK